MTTREPPEPMAPRGAFPLPTTGLPDRPTTAPTASIAPEDTLFRDPYTEFFPSQR